MESERKIRLTPDQIDRLWKECCLILSDGPNRVEDIEEKKDLMIFYARKLLSIAFIINDVICESCGGFGDKPYGSTSTSTGKPGSQTVTVGICDDCWGTGRTDINGIDLRKRHKCGQE